MSESKTVNTPGYGYVKMTRAAHGYGWEVYTRVLDSEAEAAEAKTHFILTIALLEDLNEEMKDAFGEEEGHSKQRRRSR